MILLLDSDWGRLREAESAPERHACSGEVGRRVLVFSRHILLSGDCSPHIENCSVCLVELCGKGQWGIFCVYIFWMQTVNILTIQETMSHSVSTILKKIMSSLEKVRHIDHMENYEEISKNLKRKQNSRSGSRPICISHPVLIGNTVFSKTNIRGSLFIGFFG